MAVAVDGPVQNDRISCSVVRAIIICLLLFVLLILLLILFRKNRFAVLSAWLCHPWHNVDQRRSSQNTDPTQDAPTYPMRGLPYACRLASPPPVASPSRMVGYSYP